MIVCGCGYHLPDQPVGELALEEFTVPCPGCGKVLVEKSQRGGYHA